MPNFAARPNVGRRILHPTKTMEQEKKNILVAEDNDSNYVLMTYILRNNYRYARAHNGREAVEAVQAGDIDMVLMDLNMPVMNGLEAARIISTEYPHIPVIAITANAFEADRQRARDAGCAGFLTKPVNSQQCLEMIKQLLQKSDNN